MKASKLNNQASTFKEEAMVGRAVLCPPLNANRRLRPDRRGGQRTARPTIPPGLMQRWPELSPSISRLTKCPHYTIYC